MTLKIEMKSKIEENQEPLFIPFGTAGETGKYYNELLFIAFGGTCEIGMNLTVYCYKDKLLLIDMGIGFADTKDYPGIDIVVPNIEILTRLKKNIVGLVITHAHEDHLGAVPYLWHQLSCPIYTTKFTAEVLKAKIRETEINYEIPIIEITHNQKIDLTPFSIEMFGITHSIPEMHGVMIRTEKGNIFHTGDWKFDPDPIIGPSTNLEKLHDLSNEGVLAMVCDSTNIFNEGVSGSEGTLSENLTKLIHDCNQGMVIVTTFASNIARLHTIAKAAEKSNRKVTLAGRALWRLYQAAINSGYLNDLQPFIELKKAKSYDREKLLVICTGCQGEPLAATNRMANLNHPDIILNKGDTIIFSSKIIPGNEKRIYSLFNRFCKMGIEVLTERDHFVHVSGHPSRDEVAHMYRLIKPKYAIPVHGEAIHLHEHCKFAKTLGVEDSIEVENGDLIQLSGAKPVKIAKLAMSCLGVDGTAMITESSQILRERRNMRDNGVIIVILVLNKAGRLIKTPRLLAPGLLDIRDDLKFIENLVISIRDAVYANSKREDIKIHKPISNLVRSAVRRERQKEPYVIVQVEKVF